MKKQTHYHPLLQVNIIGLIFALLLCITVCGVTPRAAASSPWETEFNDPPLSARPLTWWHWISGNITKDGITRDLEWMKKFGLSGAIVFNVGRIPDEVPRKVPFDSEAWWGMADHAIAEANRLGLKIGFHNCDGWSHSGGPWIKPEESMKKLVWTETFARAGERNIVLKQPETIRDFYRDIAIMALPIQDQDSATHSKRIDKWELKAGHKGQGRDQANFSPDRQRYAPADLNSVIAPATIVDLSGKIGTGNKLDWTPPPGNWRILRIGYTTTGKTTGPSTPEGRGLEADKFDPVALRKHYDSFLNRVVDREVNRNRTALAYTQIDSWESGIQDWTGRMEADFRELNGYDLRPYLPVLAGGHIVGSYERSDRFLWDFRKTIAHLLQEACFRTLPDLAAADGLTTILEGAGRGQFLYDPINYQSAGRIIPQGEFWAGSDHPRIDCKVAASVAHIFGGQLAASESFTGGSGTLSMGPYDIKKLGDEAFAMGVNCMVLHTSVHQPYSHLKPGFSLGGAGTHFHRNNIIYADSDAWPRYLARCQFLLRQGLFVADVLHFTGEDVPNHLGYRDELPVPLPEGYDYDGCNAEILLKHARVENGVIVLDSGMRYRVLLLPNQPAMSLELLTRIKQLVNDGAIVVGPPPQYAPGLRQYPTQDQEVGKIAAEVWADCNGTTTKEHRYGKGRVIWGKRFKEIFAGLSLAPDFSYEAEGGKKPIVNYLHRRAADQEIYFVANADGQARTIRARFRVSGKVPHLYLPDSGQIIPTANYQNQDGFVEVPLRLDPYGSTFVVFTPGPARRAVTAVAGAATPQIAYRLDNAIEAEFFAPGKYRVNYSDGASQEMTVALPEPLALGGDWDIRFPLTAAKQVKSLQSALFSWPQSDDPDIRYFSGTAVYSKTFALPAGYRAEGQKLYLDLGGVQKIASVSVNGKPCPDLWKSPYKVEITGLVTTGSNRIEIKVTNALSNRLIGDAHLPPDLFYQPDQKHDLTGLPTWLDGSVNRESERQTFTTRVFFDKNDPLQPSGLLGPITVSATRIQEL